MELRRTFHPVGHGAFYTERFYDNFGKNIFNAVYDCGCYEYGKGTICNNHIEKCIDDTFQTNDIIDALFISHFHIDHINGVAHLLSRCNVKNIFIPVLTPELIIEACIYNFIQKGSYLTDTILLLLDIADYISNSNVIYVSDERNENPTPLILSQLKKENSRTEIQSGSIIQTDFSWYYIPFCLKQNFMETLIKQEPELKKAIDKDTGDIKFCTLLYIIESKSYWYWRSIYNKVWPNCHNSYSMTICSIDAGNRLKIYNSNKEYLEIFSYNANCLYTGDYEAKEKQNFQELRGNYSRYWRNIDIIQIPHHGSKSNYNDGLFDKKRACVISAGKDDIYNLPNRETLIGILNNKCFPYIITEDLQSALSIQYKQINENKA